MYLPVNADEFNDSILSASASQPVYEHSDNEDAPPVQKIHKKSKTPEWQVEVMYRHAKDFGSEVATVKLRSHTDPRIVPGPIRFGGLGFRTWDMGGKKGLSILADSFTQETKSDKASTLPTPAKASASK